MSARDMSISGSSATPSPAEVTGGQMEQGQDFNRRSIYVLGVIILVGAFNYFDRYILGLMAPLIRADIEISDTVYGLISGFAFVLFYSLVGVPIGALSDKISRRNVISAGFVVWTVMTMLTGMVTTAVQLTVTRFLVGAGEACGSAPANAMVNDMFNQRTRGRALSIYFALSSGLSSIVLIPLAGIVSAIYGWRTTFVVAGLMGLVVAAIFFFTVTEPPRRAVAANKDEAPRSGRFLDLSFIKLPFALLMCSSALAGANLNAGMSWNAIFLNRVHGLTVTEITVALGPFRGIFSIAGVLLGGFLIDRLIRGDRRWRLWLPAISIFLIFPSQLLFLLGESRWIWMTGIGLDSIVHLMHVAPVYALAMELAGPQRRALGLSILMLCSMLVGSGLGPLLVGYLNDQLLADMGNQAIRASLVIVAAFPALASLMLLSASYVLQRDRKRQGD